MFAGNHDGTLMAVNAETGRVLWQHDLGAPFWGPPSTIMIDGRQLLLMPAGSTLTALALPTAKPATSAGPAR